MYPVNLLSVLHLPYWSNTTGTPKQTSVYPVGQPALLGHSSDENDLDTQWVCRNKHSTWIIQGLEGPNEAFIGCLSNLMNRACSGRVRYDWINSIFHRMVWQYTSSSTRLIWQTKQATGLSFLSCLLFTCAVIVCALVNKFYTFVLSCGVGRQEWCPQSWPHNRQTRT